MDLVQRPRLDVKVQELCAQLQALALQKGPEAKLPTTRQLCELFSTNSATLNDALKELEARNIIYRRQGSGIFVSQKIHRKYICILFYSRLFVAYATSPFWSILSALFAQEMERHSASGEHYYSLHMVPEPPQGEEGLPEGTVVLPEDVLQMIHDHKVHGVLAVGMQIHTFQWLSEQGVPSVGFAGFGSHMLQEDVAEHVRLAITTLQGLECRRLGLWQPYIVYNDWYEDPTYVNWYQVIEDMHMPIQRELYQEGEPLFTDPYNTILDYHEQGYRLAHKVFGKVGTSRPDGIYITNDLMTSGALSAFEELGIRAGKDVKIVSHANKGSPILANARAKQLTLLEIDPAEIVSTMFLTLERVLAGQMPEDKVLRYKPTIRFYEKPDNRYN